MRRNLAGIIHQLRVIGDSRPNGPSDVQIRSYADAMKGIIEWVNGIEIPRRGNVRKHALLDRNLSRESFRQRIRRAFRRS